MYLKANLTQKTDLRAQKTKHNRLCINEWKAYNYRLPVSRLWCNTAVGL